MRIAFVSPRYIPYKGGIETLVEAIAVRLASAGHQIEVLTLVNSSTLRDREIVNGVMIRRFRNILPSNRFLVGLSLFPYLTAHRKNYDVINVHNYHAMPLLWCSIACPERLVISTHYHGKGHSRIANLFHPFYRPIGSWAVRRAQIVICASRYEQDLVCSHLAVNSERIMVIPDGIPLTELRSAIPFDIQGTSLIYVGRLEKYKRVDLAISALAFLPDYYRLYIIGHGQEEQSLRQQVQAAKLTGRVIFLNNISNNELFRWYQSAKVLVMMSEAESFPLTSLEAMAAGCRVVCGPFQTFIELADRFPNDILVANDTSPNALSIRIMQAAETHERVKVPLDNYTWDNIALSTLMCFKKIVA